MGSRSLTPRERDTILHALHTAGHVFGSHIETMKQCIDSGGNALLRPGACESIIDQYKRQCDAVAEVLDLLVPDDEEPPAIILNGDAID